MSLLTRYVTEEMKKVPGLVEAFRGSPQASELTDRICNNLLDTLEIVGAQAVVVVYDNGRTDCSGQRALTDAARRTLLAIREVAAPTEVHDHVTPLAPGEQVGR